MAWWLGLALCCAGCTLPAPAYYYCIQITLHHPSGRVVDALECTPRARPVPWKDRPGPELLSAQ
jgi:hypothetical protein